MRGFYFITDNTLTDVPEEDQVRTAVKAGAGIIQYREKDRETARAKAPILKRLCGNTLFIVNDFPDVARQVDAGVHIGQDDTEYSEARRILGNGVIGVTVHSVNEAIAAEKMGADYLGVSPIFATATKKDAGAPAGPKLISDIKKHVKIPLAAIGGISRDNVDSVILAGADMVCAISATIIGNIEDNVRWFADKMKNR
ncbi:MAG: thiamine phosphate synthase [archaeon]